MLYKYLLQIPKVWVPNSLPMSRASRKCGYIEPFLIQKQRRGAVFSTESLGLGDREGVGGPYFGEMLYKYLLQIPKVWGPISLPMSRASRKCGSVEPFLIQVPPASETAEGGRAVLGCEVLRREASR